MKFKVTRDKQVMIASRILHLSEGLYETSDKEEIEKLKNAKDIEVAKEKAVKK